MVKWPGCPVVACKNDLCATGCLAQSPVKGDDETYLRRLRWVRDAKSGDLFDPGTFPPDERNGWGGALSEMAKWALEQIEQHETLFKLRHDADTRAIKIWRNALPGRELLLPDHTDLCVWLLNKLEPQWQPIDTAPVPPREVLKYARWRCLLQSKSGHTELGWAAYARKPGSRVETFRLQWYGGDGKVFNPIYWMPAPLPRMDTEEKA